MTFEEQIRKQVLGLGAKLCGIAAVERFARAPSGYHPRNIYSQCRSVIVFALPVPPAFLHVDSRIVYLKAMEESLAELDRISYLLAVWLEEHGIEAISLPSDAPCGDWDEATKTAKGLLSMKHAAELAGLGRIGKNTLLLNRQYGNRLMLGGVLTDQSLHSDSMAEPLCLPSCDLCLRNCPQHALDGNTLSQGLCREVIYVKNQRGTIEDRCNLCRTVCPQARGHVPSSIEDFSHIP